MANQKNIETPGVQKSLWNLSFFSILLYLLILVFLIITLGSIFADNPILKIFLVADLTTPDSVKILVSLVGLLIVKEHFSKSIKPYVTYICRQEKESIFKLDVNKNSYLLQVIIENVGGGLLIIEKVEYHYKFVNNDAVKTVDVNKILKDFKEFNLKSGRDFEFFFLFKGSAISTKSEKGLFEIDVKHLNLMEYFDATITYKNLLGDRYRKNIFFIPRRGIDKKGQNSIEIFLK